MNTLKGQHYSKKMNATIFQKEGGMLRKDGSMDLIKVERNLKECCKRTCNTTTVLR